MLQLEKWLWLLSFPAIQSKAPSLKMNPITYCPIPYPDLQWTWETIYYLLFCDRFYSFSDWYTLHVSCIFQSKQAQFCRDHIFSDHICFYPLTLTTRHFCLTFKIRDAAATKSARMARSIKSLICNKQIAMFQKSLKSLKKSPRHIVNPQYMFLN